MLTRKVSYYLHSTTHMQHATHLPQMCKIQQINCAIYFEKYLSPYVEERMHYVGLCHYYHMCIPVFTFIQWVYSIGTGYSCALIV